MGKMATMLFFDDWALETYSNIRRRMGEPKWIEEATFTDPGYSRIGQYPSVFWDEQTGCWRAFNHAFLAKYMGTDMWSLATAESDDGVHWRVPDLTGRFPDRERLQTNEVFPAGRGTERGMVYVDQREACPERRYKLMCLPSSYKDFVKGTGTHRLAVSQDGYQWEFVPDVSWGDWLSDAPNAIFYNQHHGSYVTVCRPRWGDRRVSMVETRDWRTWSQPELVMHPDPLDPPLVQLYGMPTYPYEGMYIGFLWLMHCDPCEVRFDKGAGPIDSQLAYSYDGWHFNRAFRDPFIGCSEPGLPGCGGLYAASLCVDEKHTIRIYSCGTLAEHDRQAEAKQALLLHTLRLDGFMYLESISNVGRLATRCILFQRPELKMNVQAPLGKVRVQLSDQAGRPLEGFSFDDCVPFADDSLFWEPRWVSGKTLNDVLNRPLRVEVELRHARLYAIRGAFSAVDLMTFIRRREGIAP